jgi:rhodanese-related sulfurtransferase
MLQEIQNYIKNTKNDWNYITPKEFYYKTKSYFLLDIRKKQDYDNGHIKGAKNIYWLDLFKQHNLKKIPKDKKIFIICYVGHTSSQVMTLLKLLGYDVVSIKFGYGKSPAQGIPVAGWYDYGFPIIKKHKTCKHHKSIHKTT